MSGSRGSADTHVKDDEFLIAIGQPDRPWGTVEEHSLKSAGQDVVKRTAKEIHADWARVVNQASSLVSAARTAVDGYDLHEVTFELGFTGSGRIAFVASAEIATSISVTFKRKPHEREVGGGASVPIAGPGATD